MPAPIGTASYSLLLLGGGQQKSAASLLEKRIHDLVLLAHKVLALLEAVRRTFDVDCGAVMQDALLGWIHQKSG